MTKAKVFYTVLSPPEGFFMAGSEKGFTFSFTPSSSNAEEHVEVWETVPDDLNG